MTVTISEAAFGPAQFSIIVTAIVIVVMGVAFAAIKAVRDGKNVELTVEVDTLKAEAAKLQSQIDQVAAIFGREDIPGEQTP